MSKRISIVQDKNFQTFSKEQFTFTVCICATSLSIYLCICLVSYYICGSAQSLFISVHRFSSQLYLCYFAYASIQSIYLCISLFSNCIHDTSIYTCASAQSLIVSVILLSTMYQFNVLLSINLHPSVFAIHQADNNFYV